MIIAQLSDLHVRPHGRPAYGVVDTNAAAARAVDAALALEPAPDCVLVTGDLTQGGSAEEYAIVREQLARLPMPVYVIPGNHDERGAFREALGQDYAYLPRNGFLNYVVEDLPVRLIAVDSVDQGEEGGLVCAAREAWLAARLAEGQGRPTVIFMHHPPFLTGVPGMDAVPTRVSPGFAALIGRHPEVERVLCGHYHRPVQRRFAGTIGFVAPCTAHQVALDLRPGTANHFVMEPPAIAIHAWAPETGLVSHLQPIGDYGPRRAFVEPGETALEPSDVAHA